MASLTAARRVATDASFRWRLLTPGLRALPPWTKLAGILAVLVSMPSTRYPPSTKRSDI